MATSGVSTWTLARDQIIAAALRKVGALHMGATPSTDQITEGAIALNAIVKEWQNIGVTIWTVVRTLYDFVATSGTVTPTADTIGVKSASFKAGDFEHPVKVVGWDEWVKVQDKTNPGLVQYLFYDEDSNTIYIAPQAKSGTSLIYAKVRKIEDFAAATDDADIPQRWIRALVYSLASDMADEYGIPAEERAYLSKRADDLVARAFGDQAIRDKQVPKAE